MNSYYVIVQQNQIIGFQLLSTGIPTVNEGLVYQVDIENNQIIGLNIVSKLPTSNITPIDNLRPSECIKNITCTLLHSLELIKLYPDITLDTVSKVITEAFNFVGRYNAKKSPRYVTTVRDCCTRRIGISTKAEFVSMVYEYLTGQNTHLKDVLFDKYQKGTTEDLKALTQLFNEFQL